MKKFEPHYRLVRVGAAQKIEKASRQQRMSLPVYTPFSPLCSCASNQSYMLTLDSSPQGNNGRTGQRKFGAQPRRRVRLRKTRRNERIAGRVWGAAVRGRPKTGSVWLRLRFGDFSKSVVSAIHAADSNKGRLHHQKGDLYSLLRQVFLNDCMEASPQPNPPIKTHFKQDFPSCHSRILRSSRRRACRFVTFHQIWMSPITVSQPPPPFLIPSTVEKSHVSFLH
jgi:hypothetical protein